MTSRARATGSSLADEIAQVHANDVARARELINAAIAAADAEWLPRNATAEALLSVLREMAHGSSAWRAPSERLS